MKGLPGKIVGRVELYQIGLVVFENAEHVAIKQLHGRMGADGSADEIDAVACDESADDIAGRCRGFDIQRAAGTVKSDRRGAGQRTVLEIQDSAGNNGAVQRGAG